MKSDEKQLVDSRGGAGQRRRLIRRMPMDPLTKDRELACSYLRGERDEELFAQSAPKVVAPKGSAQTLRNSARKHQVLKLHGQRGLSTTGGVKLLEVVGSDVKDFPSFEEVTS
jgi:hypothetical protein